MLEPHYKDVLLELATLYTEPHFTVSREHFTKIMNISMNLLKEIEMLHIKLENMKERGMSPMVKFTCDFCKFNTNDWELYINHSCEYMEEDSTDSYSDN